MGGLIIMTFILGGFLFLINRALKGTLGINGVFPLLSKGVDKIFGGEKLSGAKFMSIAEERKIFSSSNQGLLLDGIGKKRLDLENSFEHVVVTSPSGSGKSTKFIIPNVCRLDDCSLVITDPSGELYDKTSGDLSDRGFNIKVLNLADPQHSLCYNPMAKAESYTDIDKLAHVIMRSATPEIKPGDEIWYDEPEALISILIRCLKNTGEPEWQNLHNLLFLLQSFGADGKALIPFVERYAPRNDSNMTRNQFVAYLNGHSKMISSFLTMSRSSLKLLNNPEVASMLSRDEFDFDQLRQRKTAIYLIAPETDAEFHRFILNLFYTQLFESQKKEKYMTEDYLPLFCLLDEFGHAKVKNFSSVATTIRKYRVSLSIILQDFGQLVQQYGEAEAKTILSGACRTKIFLPGVDTDTSKLVQEMLGKVIVRQKNGGMKHRREDYLMNADEIRRIGSDEALCISSNHNPLLLKTLPSFRNPRLQSALNKPPYSFPKPLPAGNLKFITLP